MVKKESKSKWLYNDLIHDLEYARPKIFGAPSTDDEEYLKECGQNLNKARHSFSNNKEEMIGIHKKEIHELIQEVQEELDLYWADIKELKAQKYHDRQERIKANIEKNREKLSNAYDALRRYKSNADDLRDKISSAYNDDWATDAEGWLSEFEDKISDIEEQISRLESWIEEDEGKLR